MVIKVATELIHSHLEQLTCKLIALLSPNVSLESKIWQYMTEGE